MNLFYQLFIGSIMIGATVFIHAMGLDVIIRHAKRVETWLQRLALNFWRPVMSSVIVVAVFGIHIVNMWLWAFLFMGMNCEGLSDFSTALHFSTSMYTTVGHNTISLGDSCNMLSGIEGANGFLLFGWTTAFIFEVISQLYKREAREL